MRKNFDINLNIFQTIPIEPQDKTVKKGQLIFKSLDPLALACLFHLATSSKSSAIAICGLHGFISIQEAVAAARIEEDFGISKYGAVQGAHDLDEAVMYTMFASAKSLVNFAMLREY